MREGDLGYVHEGPGRVPGSSSGEGVGGGMAKVGQGSQRVPRAGRLNEEAAPTRGRGGGSKALCRIAMQRPPGRGKGAPLCS